MRIIFAGTPEFANEPLKTLITSSHEIIAVYTQPDRPKGRGRSVQFSAVKQLAIKHKLPIYQPYHLKDPVDQKIFCDLNPDLLIVVAYGLILPPYILNIPHYGCINIHASLLPRWRGAAPIQHAILADDKITGISIMQMDKGLDTGDVLLKHSCPIHPDDTSKTLQDKLSVLGAKALMEALEKLEAGTLTREKQDPNEATYATKISKQDAKLNWQNPAWDLARKIRAFNPWPVAFSQIQNQTVRIWSAKASATSVNAQPGTIIGINADSVDVATQDGLLKLQVLQLPGGKPLPVHDILNAKRSLFAMGNCFGG